MLSSASSLTSLTSSRGLYQVAAKIPCGEFSYREFSCDENSGQEQIHLHFFKILVQTKSFLILSGYVSCEPVDQLKPKKKSQLNFSTPSNSLTTEI